MTEKEFEDLLEEACKIYLKMEDAKYKKKLKLNFPYLHAHVYYKNTKRGDSYEKN